LQLSCCRTPTSPLGVVGARASRAIVTYEEAEMAEEEEEEMEEEEEEEEEMEEEMTVRCGSKRLTATISTVALPSPPPLDNSFVERVVFYRFPLEGWLRGVAVEQCAPGAEKDDDGDECNFLIYYESDDTEVPTCLAAADYDSREDAPFGSWYVVPGGMGGGGGGGLVQMWLQAHKLWATGGRQSP